MKYQEQLVQKLRSGELEYKNASIYTIIRDLVEENGVEEVFWLLHNVAFDLGVEEELESLFDEAKGAQWVDE